MWDVYQIGVSVPNFEPWLAASIDGAVVFDGKINRLVEVKCPYSCMNEQIVDFQNSVCNVPYLHFVNGILQLKTSHQYYTQIQLQMYVTSMNLCDLFVWSPKDSVTITIMRDESFLSDLVPKLRDFYFSYYLCALCDSDQS